GFLGGPAQGINIIGLGPPILSFLPTGTRSKFRTRCCNLGKIYLLSGCVKDKVDHWSRIFQTMGMMPYPLLVNNMDVAPMGFDSILKRLGIFFDRHHLIGSTTYVQHGITPFCYGCYLLNGVTLKFGYSFFVF